MKSFRVPKLSIIIVLIMNLSSAQGAPPTQTSEHQVLKALSEAILEAKLVYEEGGQDNNSIEVTTVKANRLSPSLKASLQPIQDVQSLKSVLARCVFNSKGAYGAHISPQTQSDLVWKFSQRLITLSQGAPLKFFSSPTGLPAYSLENFCDFVIVSGKYATFVQTAIMD